MTQRLRKAAESKSINGPLSGYVEGDETFVGGKERNKHKADRKPGQLIGRNTGVSMTSRANMASAQSGRIATQTTIHNRNPTRRNHGAIRSPCSGDTANGYRIPTSRAGNSARISKVKFRAENCLRQLRNLPFQQSFRRRPKLSGPERRRFVGGLKKRKIVRVVHIRMKVLPEKVAPQK